jgi:hypothetical protein
MSELWTRAVKEAREHVRQTLKAQCKHPKTFQEFQPGEREVNIDPAMLTVCTSCDEILKVEDVPSECEVLDESGAV